MDHIRRMIDDNDSSDFFEVSEKLLKLNKEKKVKPSSKKNYWEEESSEESFEDEPAEEVKLSKGKKKGASNELKALGFAEDSDDDF